MTWLQAKAIMVICDSHTRNTIFKYAIHIFLSVPKYQTCAKRLHTSAWSPQLLIMFTNLSTCIFLKFVLSFLSRFKEQYMSPTYLTVLTSSCRVQKCLSKNKTSLLCVGTLFLDVYWNQSPSGRSLWENHNQIWERTH